MFTELMGERGTAAMTAIGAVAAALLIFFLVMRMFRRSGAKTFLRGGRNRQPRLAVVDAAAVDARRRLVLVRRDDVEHLVMIGGPVDIVVEGGIGAPARSKASRPAVEEAVAGQPVAAQTTPRQAAPDTAPAERPAPPASVVAEERRSAARSSTPPPGGPGDRPIRGARAALDVGPPEPAGGQSGARQPQAHEPERREPERREPERREPERHEPERHEAERHEAPGRGPPLSASTGTSARHEPAPQPRAVPAAPTAPGGPAGRTADRSGRGDPAISGETAAIFDAARDRVFGSAPPPRPASAPQARPSDGPASHGPGAGPGDEAGPERVPPRPAAPPEPDFAAVLAAEMAEEAARARSGTSFDEGPQRHPPRREQRHPHPDEARFGDLSGVRPSGPEEARRPADGHPDRSLEEEMNRLLGESPRRR